MSITPKRKQRAEPIVYEVSSGNVFLDLGRSDPEEDFARAGLSRAIDHAIRELGLTQTEAAEQMGISQSDVSNLVRGRTRGFSLERLLRLLGRLGYDVHVTAVRRDPDAGPGALSP
jgi:predicted XRE-type DNA-binding protein